MWTDSAVPFSKLPPAVCHGHGSARAEKLGEVAPNGLVVLLVVAAEPGGLVDDGLLAGAAGEGVVGDDLGGGLVAGVAGFLGEVQDVVSVGAFGVGGGTGAWEADAGEAAGVGEDDAAVAVVR